MPHRTSHSIERAPADTVGIYCSRSAAPGSHVWVSLCAYDAAGLPRTAKVSVHDRRLSIHTVHAAVADAVRSGDIPATDAADVGAAYLSVNRACRGRRLARR